MLTIASAKLTGTPGESGWAFVYEFTPEEADKLLARGSLFAVVGTKAVEANSIDAISLGRNLVSRLHEEYFGNLEAKPFNALSLAVEKVMEEFRSSLGEIEVVASAYVDDVVYSAASGGGRVAICRGGALGTILSSDGGVTSASGFPKAGDTLLMATKSFFANVSQEVIKTALASGNPELAIGTFTPIIHEAGDLGDLAVTIVKFGDQNVFHEVVPKTPANRPEPGIGLRIRARSFLSRISEMVPKRSVYVRPAIEEDVVSQNKKVTFSVALILLGILAVSIIFGVRQKRVHDLKNKYQGILRQAQDEVDQAIALASVSPDKSRELFYQSEQKLTMIEGLHVKDPRYDALKQKISDSRAAVLGEYLASPNLFMDLSLLSSGFKGDEINTSGGNIYVLDRNGKRLVSIAFDTKKSKIVAGPTQIDEALGEASYEDRTFVLMSDGIYEVGTTKNKVIDKTWAGDALIKAFAGNLYVLDKSGNIIYRFAGSGATFGTKQNWLAAGTRADFSNARAWAIDGSVYILFPNSRVQKFSLGSPQNFSANGVVPEIGSIDAIYADADNQGVYLLDRAGKRVVVTDKKGKYIAQYIGDAIGGATNLVVSESDKKIILLTGEKLFSIDIKHLQ